MSLVSSKFEMVDPKQELNLNFEFRNLKNFEKIKSSIWRGYSKFF